MCVRERKRERERGERERRERRERGRRESEQAGVEHAHESERQNVDSRAGVLPVPRFEKKLNVQRRRGQAQHPQAFIELAEGDGSILILIELREEVDDARRVGGEGD